MFGRSGNSDTALGKFRGRVPQGSATREWPLNDEPLLTFGTKANQAENDFTLSHALTGVQVFGSTGSGKTSASIKALASSYLKAGMGGLVLTAKTDELDNWMKLAEEAGRFEDLISFSPKNKFRFNFMRYEMERPGDGAGQTENLVNLFCSILEVAERRGSGSGGDPYWQRTLKQLLRNAIDLAIIAAGEVNLPVIFKIITSAAKTREQLDDEKWQASSACYLLIEAAKEVKKSPTQEVDLELVIDYWLEEFPNLANETRSSIVSTFTSMADCFLRGTLRELFCTDLNITPEDCFDKGKIIVLNLPVKEWNELGQFAQVLFKFVWQRAVERRLPKGLGWDETQEKVRPVFLFADESHFFANSHDAQFQSTARSSRCCTVYATQNLPSYIAAFGGNQGKVEAEAFIGNLATKIFHANGDPTTNLWAADSITRTLQMRAYGGLSENHSGKKGAGFSQSAGANMAMEHSVPPHEFTLLRTGGHEYGFEVDSIIFQAGRAWLTEGKTQNFIRYTFRQ